MIKLRNLFCFILTIVCFWYQISGTRNPATGTSFLVPVSGQYVMGISAHIRGWSVNLFLNSTVKDWLIFFTVVDIRISDDICKQRVVMFPTSPELCLYTTF